MRTASPAEVHCFAIVMAVSTLMFAHAASAVPAAMPTLVSTPSCDQTITGSLTLSSDLGPCSGNGLVMGADGVTLDCKGHAINGVMDGNNVGIVLDGRHNVTVKRCSITGFVFGIELTHSSNNSFLLNQVNFNEEGFFASLGSSFNVYANNTAEGSIDDNFDIQEGVNNTLVWNTGNDSQNQVGFFLANTAWNILSHNTAKGNDRNGFDLDGAHANILRDNIAGNNVYDGFTLEGNSWGNILVRNVADRSVDEDGFHLTQSNSNILQDNSANYNYWNDYYIDSSRNNLTANTASYSDDGFYITGSARSNNLTSNVSFGNSMHGFIDVSDGTGTSNTSNWYHSDVCFDNALGNAPAGLCATAISSTTTSSLQSIPFDTTSTNSSSTWSESSSSSAAEPTQIPEFPTENTVLLVTAAVTITSFLLARRRPSDERDIM